MMVELGEISMQSAVAMALLIVVLAAAALSDCRTGLVRNALTYTAVAAGFAWALLGGWLSGGVHGAALEATASMAAFGAALLGFTLIYVMGALGGGDVKLMAAVGAISGDWRVVLATTVYAFVVGAVMALGVMVGRGVVRQTGRRLLVAAMLSASRAKVELADDEPTAGHVPFAVAIAIGGIVAGAELLLGVWTPWAGFAG